MRELTRLLVLVAFAASSVGAQDGITSLRAGRQPQVLVLGTFHFQDAGLDGYKPTFPFDIRTPARQQELEQVLAILAEHEIATVRDVPDPMRSNQPSQAPSSTRGQCMPDFEKNSFSAASKLSPSCIVANGFTR